mmetsp:Transcript_19753/g.49873  ORF Transcript_19753/g.49873 Transcript_19753/m.49873 type:complete len:800 (+) Transcript_19753:151-2550(+)
MSGRDYRDRERDRERRRDGGRRRSKSRERERDGDRTRERHRNRERDSKRSRSRSPHKSRKRNRSRTPEKERGERARGSVRFEGDNNEGRRHEHAGADAHGGRPGRPVNEQYLPKKEEEEEGEQKPKKEPLSLEELLKKKKEEEASLAKPVFLTKAQRQELALKKRQEEVEAQRASLEGMRNQSRQLASNMQRARDGDSRHTGRVNDAARNRHMSKDDVDRLKELESIKAQYLGQEKVKKRMLKPSDKFKFNFDWENSEDTSKDFNPLYNNLHEAPLLFGRGMRAGADRREQKKQAALHERELLTKMRGGKELTTEELAREKAAEERADKYDRGDMLVSSHWATKKLEEMTERDWRIFREDFNIAYRGSNPPLPYRTWDECPLPKALRKAVDKAGYKKPSPIQMAAIPIGLQQRDVIGLAETGSGKTCAFVLPMLIYIMKQPPMTEEIEAEGPYALIMAPTRELVLQIDEETQKLAEYTGFRVTHVVGGQSIEEQGFQLRKGCEIVVATPGRMQDCLERHYAVLNQCNYVVLDEADRMIDMGFEPQVLGVMEAMPSSNLKPENEEAAMEEDKVYRTTYMFSATMPPAVERIARKYLRRPVVVQIGSVGRATVNVTQVVKMLPGKSPDSQKIAMLEEHLYEVNGKPTIVFVNTRAHCDSVTRALEHSGHSCIVLHGGKAQDAREVSLEGFKSGKYNVLVATDVAGRGIDVQDVALVVNYDMPNTIEAYTHRIGRTGRAGKKGTAVSFVTGGDTEVYFDLKKLLTDSNQTVPPELARHEAARIDPKSQAGQKKRSDTVYASK